VRHRWTGWVLSGSFLPDGHGWLGLSTDVGGGGLVATDDGGRTWRHLRTPHEEEDPVVSLSFLDDGDGLILLSASEGESLWRTADGGEHWVAVQRWPGRPAPGRFV
jgi:photosystem II stability/assembly factor-like uncharacterized protein